MRWLVVILVLAGLLPLVGAQPNLRLETGLGHTGSVPFAAFSPDDRYLITSGIDETARVWDVASGKELCRLGGHGYDVLCASFSPDGRYVVTKSGDGVLHLWSVATAKVVRKMEGPRDNLWMFPLAGVEFSPDGSRVVTAGREGAATVWDVRSGKVIQRFKGHLQRVSSASFSPNGRQLLTSSDDGTIRIWNALTGKVILSIMWRKDAVNFASFSPDGKVIASASGDVVSLWDASTGRKLRDFIGHSSTVNCVRFSPDGQRIVTASDDKTARLWDTSSGLTLRRLSGSEDQVRSAIFSYDGRSVVTASMYEVPQVWDTESGALVRRFEDQGSGVRGAFYSPGRGLLATASNDGIARVWNVNTGGESHRFIGHSDAVTSVAVSPSGSMVLTASWDQTTRVWDTATGKELLVFPDQHQDNEATFSPDGHYVLTIGRGYQAQLWDLSIGKITMKCFAGGTVASFSPDGRSFVVAGGDETAWLWDAATGTRMFPFRGHGDEVRDASFSADGRFLVTASTDRSVRVWNVASGKEERQFHGHTNSAEQAVFSPDGRHVLSVGTDNTARLWDRLSGKQVLSVKGRFASAAFILGGKMLLTASWDGTTRLWDAVTGRELCSLISYHDGGWAVTTPQGLYDSSDSGLNPHLYWVYEDPAKGILDTIDVTQLKGSFYVAGLLSKVMKGEQLPAVDLRKLPIFPKVDDVRPRGSTVAFNLEDRGGGIGEVRVFVDQQLAKTAKGQAGANTIDLGDLLNSRPDAQIEVTASNRDDSLASPRAGSASGAREEAVTPTRYVAVIAGVYKYAGNNDGLSELRYAGDDAIAIARSALALARGLKLEPEVYLLTDHPGAAELKKEGIIVLPSTKAAFRDVFEKMIPAKGVWRKSDLMLLFMAGHGTALTTDSGSRYAYFTSDALSADPKAILQNQEKWVVTDEDLVRWFTKIPGGKKALILDTCGAEAAIQGLALARSDEDRARTLRDLQLNTGMVALFGAASNAVSWELNGHGLLTYSLLRALATLDLGQGTANAVQVEALFSQVKKLTEEEAERNKLVQRPHSYTRNQNFPIGFLDAEGRSKIPFFSPVPLFGRVSLASSESGLDDLELEIALSEALKTVAEARGTQPSPLRFAVGATVGVQVRGLYSLKGDVVEVKLNILPPGKPPVPILVTATRAQIVSKMVEAITTWAKAQKL